MSKDVLERAEILINKFRNQWGYHPRDGEKMVCDLVAEVRALRASVDSVLSCWSCSPDGVDAGGLAVALDELRAARDEK